MVSSGKKLVAAKGGGFRVVATRVAESSAAGAQPAKTADQASETAALIASFKPIKEMNMDQMRTEERAISSRLTKNLMNTVSARKEPGRLSQQEQSRLIARFTALNDRIRRLNTAAGMRGR